MKSINFTVIFILVSLSAYSQIIENNEGIIVNGSFEGCFNEDEGDITNLPINLQLCYDLIDNSYCNWDVIGDIPSFCHHESNESGLLYYHANSGKKSGLLLKNIHNGTTIQPSLNANFTGLIPGANYNLEFYQLNLTFIGGGNIDLDYGYVIKIDGKQYVVPSTQPIPLMLIHESNENRWQKSIISFCATKSNHSFSISAEIFNHEVTNATCFLGIDDVSLSLNTESTETCEVPCVNCTSFELVREEKYVISGWVKQTTQTYLDVKTPSYSHDTFLEVKFYDSFENELPTANFPFYPIGDVIDGWQKISGIFTVPLAAGEISIGLMNESENVAFFDDIRVHPFNGNLKSFVYDQVTQKLMAELDENNYATFYEYDKEGGLVRVKKETEKGVFTIQETRSSNRKKED